MSPSQIHPKSHNVSLLLYHLVFPTKYRKKVLSPKVVRLLLRSCRGIEERYEIKFHEIGTDEDHIHFLLQSVPSYSPGKLVRIIKSITAGEILKGAPGVKRALWGGKFWSSSYYIATVGKHVNEKVISNYVKEQGKPKKSYKKLADPNQLKLFAE